MTVLIVAEPKDSHAAAAKWGLRKIGATVKHIAFTDFPKRLTVAIRPSQPLSVTLQGPGIKEDFSDVSTVWFRRFSDAQLPAGMHDSDRRYALRDWDHIQNYIHQSQELRQIRSINPPSSSRTRDLKPFQLDLASRCGLRIPETIITNDVSIILEFIEANQASGLKTIVKSLDPMAWVRNTGQVYSLPTQIVTAQDVLGADASSAPLIYQRYVEKAFEVRLTIMGRTAVAAKLNSQFFESSKIDFRRVLDWRSLGCEEIIPPKDIMESVFEFMARSNLTFGTMDFAVTPDGEWVFFENNEQGNFLWVERANPNVPILDCFVRFLHSNESNFVYRRSDADRLRLSDYSVYVEQNRQELEREAASFAPVSPPNYMTDH
jgi:hypothetical protein